MEKKGFMNVILHGDGLPDGIAFNLQQSIRKKISSYFSPETLTKLETLFYIYNNYRECWPYMDREYDGMRERFYKKYDEKFERVVLKGKDIPNYHRFLRDLFYISADKKFQDFFKNLDMNKLFLKNHFEIVDIDSGDITEVTNRVDFQNKLIEILKFRFPNVGKNNYHIFKSKKFFQEVNKEFYKLFLNKFKDYELYFIELENNVQNYIMLASDEMEFMVRNLFVIDHNNDDFFYEYVQTIVNYALYKFLSSEKIKKGSNKTAKHESNENFWGVNLGCFDNPSAKMTFEEGEIIEKIQRLLFPLDEKKQKYFGKYLTRLFNNGKDIRISSIYEKFGLYKIPENVKELLDELNIDIIYDKKAEKQEGQNGSTQVVVESKEENTNHHIPLSFSFLTESNADTSEHVDNDPMTVLEKVIGEMASPYRIRNKEKLKKQLNSICRTPTLRNIVCNAIRGDKFGNPIKRYPVNSNNYSLEVEGNSGFRFLLSKHDTYFMIEGFYTHDDYENRMKNT